MPMSEDHRPCAPDTARAVPPLRAAALGTGVAVVLALTGAAHAADPARPVPECASARHPVAAAGVWAGIQEVVTERSGDIAVGVSAFGGELTCGYQAERGYDAASVGKVLVLTTLLRTAQLAGRGLTAEEQTLATEMITVSDNEATRRLRDLLGPARLQEFLDAAGMTRTRLNEDRHIGLTKINARDELRLLDLLVSPNAVLGDAQRGYALDLMGSVVPDQRWGVTAGAPEGAAAHLKNGWLPYPDTQIWRVNSIATFTGTPVGTYHIVVLTDGNDGMAHGVETIERIATRVHAALNTPEPGAPDPTGPPRPDGSERP
ncbi:serine hydrolase [Allonocardiopsis opalescens]|uniref:Beta-lactamase family protein n=1 Tax=Allonocardiopsis opalescens TaxID=1144618 RepID=A0A2T0PVY3_9ACTN|nr:serine hydrolase [Allonocardiopsis opalescens]PRX95681.1 beta-lactamase family protein [Allonocardiopsis opalescens]